MKLSGITPQIKTENKVQAKRGQGPATAKTDAVSGAGGPDRVELSASSMDFQKAQEVLEQTPAVRADKVQRLKEKIQRGEYQVDPYRIADKMLLDLLSENIAPGK